MLRQQPVASMSDDMLDLMIESLLWHWNKQSKFRKETAEYLSDLFAELARRL